MQIGIGVTTYNRPYLLERWKRNIAKNTSFDNVLIYIAEDTKQDRKGIAVRKNECLEALKECDHIFLFDDDCWPIKPGWEQFFINFGQKHLLFLNDKLHNFKNEANGIRYYSDCGGVFMYFNNEILKNNFRFNEQYKVYGFEHAELSIKILGEKNNYPSLKLSNIYLHSEDYSNPKHESSIDKYEKSYWTNRNAFVFKRNLNLIDL